MMMDGSQYGVLRKQRLERVRREESLEVDRTGEEDHQLLLRL